jgi:hypothetical protein
MTVTFRAGGNPRVLYDRSESDAARKSRNIVSFQFTDIDECTLGCFGRLQLSAINEILKNANNQNSEGQDRSGPMGCLEIEKIVWQIGLVMAWDIFWLFGWYGFASYGHRTRPSRFTPIEAAAGFGPWGA